MLFHVYIAKNVSFIFQFVKVCNRLLIYWFVNEDIKSNVITVQVAHKIFINWHVSTRHMILHAVLISNRLHRHAIGNGIDNKPHKFRLAHAQKYVVWTVFQSSVWSTAKQYTYNTPGIREDLLFNAVLVFFLSIHQWREHAMS